MAIKLGIGNIDLRNIRSAFSWLRYWTTLISAVVEDAAPTNVVLTFPSGKPSLVATDLTCTVNGVARTISSASWTGAVWTVVLSSAVIYGDVIVITFVRTGQTANVTNNITVDANADAFFTATGITDNTQKRAVNRFVVALKAINAISASFVDFDTPANGVLKAIYPFVGGTATRHKFNLINPADTDAAFRLDFNGGLTHDANGILPDGSTGFADTHLTPATHLPSVNSISLVYYSLTNNTKNAFDIGAYDDATAAITLSLKYTALGGLNSYISGSGTSKITIDTETRGLFLNNRISNIRHDVYRNHELIGSNTTANAGSLTNVLSIYLFAEHDTSGAESALHFTDRRCCYAHVTAGIPDVAIQLYIKAVQDMQTDLSRGYTYVPLMATTGSPAASARVKVNLVGWNANVWHSLYLPSNYSVSRTWPIIIELPGNLYSHGNGTPDDYYMGHGLSQGKDFIWAVAPFLNTLGTANAPTWWGDGTVGGDYVKTIEYWDAIIADIVANYHGDSSKVILMGFSRGAIAVNYIGCSSDLEATKFIAFMPHSHHDGGTFTPVGADTRIARMLGKKTCITYGGTLLDSGYANSQTGLGIVQAEGVTEEHYQITDMGHDLEHSLRNGDTAVNSIRVWLAQYK